MTKPVLKPLQTVAVAVYDKNDTRTVVLGDNLDPSIKKRDVTVEYWKGGTKVQDVDVRKAQVKKSNLILKMGKLTARKSDAIGEDELIVVVTNPGGETSEPTPVPIVFED